ncbi:BatA (Bacteroides aerotolerance operon) [hydrothermal vent metagenome]|uniref:BatA (Bacteroides aerotolerance operon) n=1 Tax=hydrothermal vent metagenome TaxID=652676 RepID=A0A1W1EJ89_9ZZZZ
MNNFEFQYPEIFLLILLFLICAKFCKAKVESIYFPHINKLFIQSFKQDRLISILKWLGIILAITALASPVFKEEFKNSKKDGRDIVLVLDSSESMYQRGFDRNNINRDKFSVTKEIISEFIKKRTQDRLGLITFGDIAFCASPLTFEKKFLNSILKMQRIGIAGRRTAINDAIIQAYSLLEKSKAKSKIIILLTDGMDNMSKVSFEEVKELIKVGGAKLYTIGIGTSRDYNAPYLKALAEAGNGKFFGAKNSEMLEKIYAQIDKLEVTKIDNKRVVTYEYLYIYPLFLAILLLLLYIYIRTQKGL